MKATPRLMVAVAGACMMTFALSATTPFTPATRAAAATAKTFASPDAAVDALIAAADKYDVPELKAIFGPEGDDIIDSGEPARDKARAAEFVAKAREKKQITTDPSAPGRATLVIGDEDWPFPVPLVKRDDGWVFDSKAGLQEILYRRIGANELDAIQICRGYVEAQDEYAETKHAGSEVAQYAQRIISTPGKQDGLAWQNADGSWGGPIGENVAKALTEGYAKGSPYHGYFFKILKGQGPAAPLGKLDYVVKGIMIGGFALAAAPAEYRVTGVKTFIVSNDGIVYEKDLGPTTLDQFKKMELFNPDQTWQPVSSAEGEETATAQ